MESNLKSKVPVLYSYWRSSCSWRVRIALHLKNVDYEYRAIHLVKDGGEQLKDEYRDVNPLAQVPAYIDYTEDGEPITITQSLAIMEYLEEKYPTQGINILGHDIFQRAKVRQISEMINSGTQPIQNLSVMNHHSSDQKEKSAWSKHFIDKGLKAVEKILEQTSGKYCVGNFISMADCCLVPQVYNAKRFNVDLDQFPMIRKIVDALESEDAFVKAHPQLQPDSQ